MLISQQVENVFEKLLQVFPEPKSELNFNSDFELLVAVLLSAHTTDKSVNQATQHLFKVANTPQKMLELGEEKLKTYIKNIGLYNAKAINLLKTCEILVNEYDSQIPNKREDLEKLPGVGRKTASVVLNVAFNQPTVAVDTHVFRVAQRLQWAYGKTPKAIEEQLLQIIPEKYLYITNHLLVLHGRYVCKARFPLCEKCVLRQDCPAYNK